MVFMLRTAIVAAIVWTFFGQQVLAAPLDKRASLSPPQKYGGVIGSVTEAVPKLENDAQIKKLAETELAVFTTYIQRNKLTVSEGISVYMKTDGTIVIAAIGAGSGMHGEQNVKTICNSAGIPFHGGEIFTYSHKWGFMTACNGPTPANTNRRNCAALVGNNQIKDIAIRLKKLKQAF